MNKRDLVAEVSARLGREPSEVAEVVDAIVDSIVGSVAGGERVVIQGFGTFVRRARARRVARDINADRPVVVPATHVPAFQPGKPFREIVAARRRRRAGSAGGSSASAKRTRARAPTVLRRGAVRTAPRTRGKVP
jgi:DNA-binding protein HU-beta